MLKGSFFPLTFNTNAMCFSKIFKKQLEYFMLKKNKTNTKILYLYLYKTPFRQSSLKNLNKNIKKIYKNIKFINIC